MSNRTAALLLVLCACETSPGASGLSAEGTLAAAMPTVLEVSWSGAEAGATVFAEWGADEQYGQRVELGSGAEGEGVLVGLHPDTEVSWRLVTDDGATSDGAVVQTGSAPTDLPTLEVTATGETTGGLVLTSTLDGRTAYAVAYDHEGVPVWWSPFGEGEGIFTDVRPTADGRGVVYQTTDLKMEVDIAKITVRGWNGEELETTVTPNGHHAFVTLPDGGYGFCAVDVREAEIDGETWSVVGDLIAELPPGGDAETDLRVVWSSWDTLPNRADPEKGAGFYSFGLDWTHCNGLAYDAEREKYLVSMYMLGSVAQVDRATGAMDWVLGGEDGTLRFVGGQPFTAVHSPEVIDGGVRLFNNYVRDPLHSQVVAYTIDEAAGTATVVETVDLEREFYSYILGDTNALPDDHLLVSWGSSGFLTELDAARDVVWKGSLPLGVIVGFSSDVQVPGQPGS